MTDASLLQSILDKSQDVPRLEQFQEQVETHDVKVTAFGEWRFEIGPNDKLKLKLVEGTAEIFGTELSPNIEYLFQGSFKSCVASFTGCTLRYWNCTPKSEYLSEESCMGSYFNLSMALEKRRMQGHAPKVLIIGSKDSGKSGLSRTLVSYAEKTNRVPLLVNLNPRDPLFNVPACLTATGISDMLDVENIDLGEAVTTGPSFYHQKQPLVKCFGLENYRDNIKLYTYLIQQLSQTVAQRLVNSVDIQNGGLVIDTPAFHIGDCEVIQTIVDAFGIDVLVVIGNERLLVDLRKKLRYDTNQLTLIKVPQSSGCVEKDDKFIREMQQRSIKEYFYGIDSSQLSPYTIMITLKDFIFLQPRVLEDVNMSFLAGGDEEDSKQKFVNPLEFLERLKSPGVANLENAILALTDDSGADTIKHINSASESPLDLISTVAPRAVLGFCYVLGVDDEKGKAKLLVPSPVQQLPTKTLILTQLRYHE